MNIDKNTCWYNDFGANAMNKYYDESVKPFSKEKLLLDVYHLKIFNNIINTIEGNILDLGCGTAAISVFCNNYCGADLSHIIENCSKRNFPMYKYYGVDLINDNLDFIREYNIIILNAIIDIMENPLNILNKILTNSSKYVILHRQEISKNNSTKVITNPSYDGYTYHSIINENDFLDIIKLNNFNIIREEFLNFGWENGGKTYLSKKII